MPNKSYAFYPGCSSQKGASAANYLTSVNTVCAKLDLKLTPIPDWNCCGASISYAGGSEFSRQVLNARNLALAEKHLPGQDVVATCAACWLAARETRDQLVENPALRGEANEALRAGGLQYEGSAKVRHMVEVMIEDLGLEALARPVVKALDGLKIAGYVGCQTNRPFGIAGESFENPQYLDRLIEAAGATALTEYDQKVSCCGGALAFTEPEKSQAQIKTIVEAAYDAGADLIVTPCPLCQANVEVYQSQINARHGTRLNMPVAYYSELLAVAYGASAKEAGLDGHVIAPGKLIEQAAK